MRSLIPYLSGVQSFFEQFGTPFFQWAGFNGSGADGNKYQLMRSSDKALANFTYEQVKDGTATTWVNEDVNLYTSDFTAGISDFDTTSNAVIAAPITVDGVDDTLRLTCNAVTGGHNAIKFSVFNADGSDIDISFDYYIPSSNAAVDGMQLWIPGSTGQIIGNTLDAWTSTSGTITNSGGASLFVSARDGSSLSFGGADGDVIYVKNIVITQTTANGTIQSFYDPANGYTLTQTTETQQATLITAGTLNVVNGEPAPYFDGANTYYRLNNPTLVDNITDGSFTMVVVAKVRDITSGVDQNILVVNDTTSGNGIGAVSARSGQVRAGFYDTAWNSESKTTANNSLNIITGEWNGSIFDLLVNTDANDGISPPTTDGSPEGLALGVGNNGNWNFDGDILFAAVYDTTALDLAELTTYLNDIYGAY